jgi:integrase
VKDGSRTWVFRWQVGGKVKRVGFGPTHTLGLADARERAEDARRQLLDGVDPRQARRAKQVALAAADPLSFDQVAAKYIEANAPSWRNPKHAKQWTSTLEQYASPIIGKLPVHEVETAHVLRIVQPIWHTKNETASRVRGRVEAILGYATALNYRDGANPATWKGHLEHLLPERDKVRKVEHHAALPYAELPTFLRQLRKRYGIGPLALEFAILTAARTGEVLWATWSEVDIAHQLWTIPAERMKAEREHSVPLCDRAVAILREMQTLRHNSPYVFPGARRRKPLSNMALLTVLRRMGRGDLTAHGFRSSFASGPASAPTISAN